MHKRKLGMLISYNIVWNLPTFFFIWQESIKHQVDVVWKGICILLSQQDIGFLKQRLLPMAGEGFTRPVPPLYAATCVPNIYIYMLPCVNQGFLSLWEFFEWRGAAACLCSRGPPSTCKPDWSERWGASAKSAVARWKSLQLLDSLAAVEATGFAPCYVLIPCTHRSSSSVRGCAAEAWALVERTVK